MASGRKVSPSPARGAHGISRKASTRPKKPTPPAVLAASHPLAQIPPAASELIGSLELPFSILGFTANRPKPGLRRTRSQAGTAHRISWRGEAGNGLPVGEGSKGAGFQASPCSSMLSDTYRNAICAASVFRSSIRTIVRQQRQRPGSHPSPSSPPLA
jgi:hypothetical protein